jgi:WD40 repeat protein
MGSALGGSLQVSTAIACGRLASGSIDRTIRLWDIERSAETARLEGHTDWVMALAPLSDGRLASGSNDKTIRLWDLKRGAVPRRFDWVELQRAM